MVHESGYTTHIQNINSIPISIFFSLLSSGSFCGIPAFEVYRRL